ncbi:cholesterol 25-hydroxylase-like protein [Anguilla rostrata]|uniref:cholesterol 25-hydroxylase-like protein n=1 Tax=Anguilla rostrata TaxID=7938 RepID=UPI0030D0F1D1
MYFTQLRVMNNTCGLSHQHGGLLLQPVWDYFLHRREWLLSPYLAAGVAFFSHLLICAPFLALDVVRCRWLALNRYKISGNSELAVCVRLWFNSVLRIFWNYLICILPATVILHRLRSSKMPALAPTCWQALWQIASSLFLFDALFYFWHVVMHRVPWLYRRVHQAHHQNPDVFALTAQDASAVELLCLQTIALCSATLVGCHPLSEIIFHLLNMWLAAEDHCGYDLPWALHKILPFFGGAPFHQLHHRKFRGNYAPYFKHWDRLFGTELTEETP